MSSYVRYFADAPLNLKGLAAALKGIDPSIKIDGGELLQGTQMLAEVTIDSAGSDMFNEEIQARMQALHALQNQGAQFVMQRMQQTQSIVAIRLDPNIPWEMLNPLWTVLPNMSTGLTQVDGQGYYDGQQFLVAIV